MKCRYHRAWIRHVSYQWTWSSPIFLASLTPQHTPTIFSPARIVTS